MKTFLATALVLSTAIVASCHAADASPAIPPVYEGFHDRANCEEIAGWAWDKNNPTEPITVDLYDSQSHIATVSADRFRDDLLKAGIGNGRHGFIYPLPRHLRNGKPHAIQVRYAGTSAELTGSPQSITCNHYLRSALLAIENYIIALTWIHVMWFYFYLSGTLLRSPRRSSALYIHSPAVPPLADFVITCVAGMSITGFILLLLGSLALLSPIPILCSLVAPLLGSYLLKRERVLGRRFWWHEIAQIKGSWSTPAILIYVAFLGIGVPSVLPPTAWDSISYHLAYAVDWAIAGKIFVDIFLRYPYYANNFLPLHAFLFSADLGRYCQFLTWLCGLLSCLGICAVLAPSSEPSAVRRLPHGLELLIATLIPLSVATSPVFLKYVNVAYIDIPIGLWVLAGVLCWHFGRHARVENYLPALVVIGAFCVGMKLTNIVLVPMFGGLIVALSWRTRRKVAVAALLGLCVLSAPWFLRNWLVVGDPVPPILNLWLGRQDPIFTLADYSLVKAAIEPRAGVAWRALAPYMLFAQPAKLKDVGATLLTVLAYLPLLLAPALFIRGIGSWRNQSIRHLTFVLVYLLGTWLVISPLGRYFVHLLPILGCYVGLLLKELWHALDKEGAQTSARVAFPSWCVALVLVVLLLPSPSSSQFYMDLAYLNWRTLSGRLLEDDAYLSARLFGYSSTASIIERFNTVERDQRQALVIGFENLAFYFRRGGVTSVGDWVGPGRYSDLPRVVTGGALSAYLAAFRVRAVMINTRMVELIMDRATQRRFATELIELGFVPDPGPEDDVIIYTKGLAVGDARAGKPSVLRK